MSVGAAGHGNSWLAMAAAANSQTLLSRHAARCLRYIAAHPGARSAAVQDGVGIDYPAQASQVLRLLERNGLIHTERGPRPLNAWHITDLGANALSNLPEGIYE